MYTLCIFELQSAYNYVLAKKPHALNLQLLNYRFDNIFFRQNDTNQFSFAYYDSPMLR